jgi:hypothetical protein
LLDKKYATVGCNDYSSEARKYTILLHNSGVMISKGFSVIQTSYILKVWYHFHIVNRSWLTLGICPENLSSYHDMNQIFEVLSVLVNICYHFGEHIRQYGKSDCHTKLYHIKENEDRNSLQNVSIWLNNNVADCPRKFYNIHVLWKFKVSQRSFTLHHKWKCA